MKPKYLILFLACLTISFSTEAQILKKLKKKAEAAAERTLLNKTDEIVSKKTEQAIDSVATSKPNKKEKNKNVTSSTKTQNSEADLHLQASVQPESTQLGGAVTFTIAVNNKGPAIAKDIVSKVHIPSSYSITNISVTQGSYNQDTKLWQVGTLKEWSRAVMTILVVVMGDSDLMTTGEIISCSVKDPDSKPGNGIDTNGNGDIIDDRDDEDDGDGQDVKISDLAIDNSENDGSNSDDTESNSTIEVAIDEDIKLVMEHKRDKVISYLDFDTMAMRMEYHSKGKNPDPVYWDKDGYIYSGEKGQYYKIPFSQVKNMGKNITKMFSKGNKGMPGAVLPKVNGKTVDLEFPNEPIVYNGYKIRVYPDRYPIVEWAFMYHPKIFRGADNVKEEIVECRGNSNCTKFTLTDGKEAGSTVLFDHKERLAEITNPDGASAIYTYEPATVKLPNAQEYNFNFSKN